MSSERARRRFLEIFAPHLDDAFALAKWIAADSSDAEDIVQEAALRALDDLERTEVAQGKSWTLAIVRNTALTWMARRRPSVVSFVGDLHDLDQLELPPEDLRSAEDAMIAEENGVLVRQAIADLPSPLKETLILREINGLNYREISEATGAPVGTVMSRLARARAAMARALKDLR